MIRRRDQPGQMLRTIDSKYEIGDIVQIPRSESKEFGRIATQNAKNRDSSEDP